MAQLQRIQKSFDSPKTPNAPNSPTFAQLMRDEDIRKSSCMSPTLGKNLDQEEYISTNQRKKSVFSKVKERAKKLRHSLSGKKKQGIVQHHRRNSTPAWGVSLADHEDEDIFDDADEYLGAPLYDSELATDNHEQTSQHPKAGPVVSEKHVLPGSIKRDAKLENDKAVVGPTSSNLDKTNHITSKIAGLSITKHEVQANGKHADSTAPPDTVSMHQFSGSQEEQDKEISLKEYFMNKLETGDDEKSLQQAITNAMSPSKKTSGETGMMEKMKEVVTSYLWPQEASQSINNTTNSSTDFPAISTDSSSASHPLSLTNKHTPPVSVSAGPNS